MKTKTGSRNREHGVIDDSSVRLVGMDPRLAREVVREEEDLRYPLLASSLEPPRVALDVADAPHATLANGLGANWSPAGQGEEAFPEDADEAGWAKVFGAMTSAGIRWVRYWLQPGFVARDGRLDRTHRFLARLDRLQRWAAQQDAAIMLELATVPADFQAGGVHDAPADNQRYVDEYIVPVVRHVMLERGCDRIRQLCLFNEPFNPDVRPYIFYPPPGREPLDYYVDLHERLRAALDRIGLQRLGLIGPNSANLFQRHIEMFEDKGLGPRVTRAFAELDCHQWRLRFDYYPPSKRWPGYTVTEGIERYLEPTLAAARRLGKPLSLTEAGAMYFNENPCTARVAQHDAFLVMAEGLVRSINAGVAGAMIWSFTSAGRTDGQWGWIGPRQAGFAPVPNLLNGFTALMRYHRPGAAIHRCVVRPSDFAPFISAGALAMPGAGETLWLLNDHPVENIRVTVRLPAGWSRRPLHGVRKGFAPELQRLDALPAGAEVTCVLPGMSLTTWTTLPYTSNWPPAPPCRSSRKRNRLTH
jgi:hypothetical protein